MKGLFIDAGANIGQAFAHFQECYPLDRFDYWLIEPNPNCIPMLQQHAGPGVSVFARALWDRHTHLDLYCTPERGATDPGRSVEKSHNSLYYRAMRAHAIRVETVDCNSLLTLAAQRYTPIVCKLDIESAEYRVLEAWLDSGQIRNIHTLYVEFHTQYMKKMDREAYMPREQRIKARLTKLDIDWREWH